jgi:norsolorinic acid ketoreductase
LVPEKGIGAGFVKHYLQRPNTIVVAGVRVPNSPGAENLFRLDCAAGSRVILVTINAKSDTNASEAVQALTSQYGIDRLDIVIANAGIFDTAAAQKIVDMKLTDLQEHIDVNAYSVIRLFQATWPLLERSKKPIFLLNSAGAGSIGSLKSGTGMQNFPLTSYASSKLLANFIEHPKLISFAVHPGSVVTENRTAAARKLGVPVEGLSVDDSVSSLLSLVCILMHTEPWAWLEIT